MLMVLLNMRAISCTHTVMYPLIHYSVFEKHNVEPNISCIFFCILITVALISQVTVLTLKFKLQPLRDMTIALGFYSLFIGIPALVLKKSNI